MKDALTITEDFFYSIQGEGQTVGVPSVFMRLTGCCLKCLWCDTLDVWNKGKDYLFPEILDLMESKGFVSALNKGAHLVVTGGDPLLQQDQLIKFFWYLGDRLQIARSSWVVEIETEGVLMPYHALLPFVRYWNVSPKLSNSGMPKNRRYKKEVLEFHRKQNISKVCSTIFKFPVGKESDVEEVLAIQKDCAIPSTMVYLMPLCNTRKSFELKGPQVAEWCKKYGFRLSPRLHLTLWDRATGV